MTELVVSPYSTALASLVTPSDAADNFARLQSLGLEGRYGFYESLDYTPRHRDVEGPTDAVSGPVVVRAFFAHHQGMSLVALANVVLHDVFVARFHADPRIQATELLLQERVPREAILSEPRPAEAATTRPSLPVFASRRFVSPQTTSVHSHFLSNGRYTTTVGNDGSGYSMWGDVAVTRRREDPTAAAGGHYIYLRDPWSKPRLVGDAPACRVRSPDRFEATFDLDKITFRRRDGDIESLLEITVSSEDDVEVRRLKITNRGTHAREIEITSYVEIVLSRPEDDLAHPAFGKLFVESEFDAHSAGLLFSRRQRSADEPPLAGLSRPGRRWTAARWRGRMGNGSRTVPRSWALAGQSDRARGPRIVRHHRGGTRSHRCAARAYSHRTRRQSSAWHSPPASHRIGMPPSRWRGSIATAAPQRAPFRWRSPTCTSRLQHLGLSDEHAMLFDRLGSRVFGSDMQCISPADIAANIFGQQNLWGYGISGDLPIVLAACVGRGVVAAGAAAAQRPGILASERAARRRRDPERASRGLPRRDAEPADQPRAAADAGPAGWASPAACLLLRGDGMPDVDRRLLGAVARVVLPGDLGDLVSQLERPAPWLYGAHDVPTDAVLAAPAAASTARAGAGARHGERPRRLHARRPRVRHRARRRSRDAAALVERHRQSRRSARS